MTNNDLELAIRAARSAGQILLEFWAKRSELTVSNKRAGDFVSDADVSAENHLREVLLGSARGIAGWVRKAVGLGNLDGAG